MRGWRTAALEVMATVGGVPVAAAPAPAGDIVVTARIRDAAVLERLTADYVRRVAGVPVQGQYARWNQALCPKIVGLDDVHAGIVLARIRAAAGHAGVAIAPAGCRTNMTAGFVADAKAAVATMLARRPAMLRSASLEERRAVTGGDLAVRWWYATEVEGSDGHRLMAESAALPNGTELPHREDSGYLDSYRSSLIDTKMRVSLTAATILVDVGRASGTRLVALADYVAFVGLTRTRMANGFTGVPTILDLFADRAGDRPAVDGLTPWDIAYLSGLYRASPSRPALAQRGLIAGTMRAAAPVEARRPE